MQTVYFIILVPMVYLSVAVCFFGTAATLIKIFKQPLPSATLKIFPEKKPAWAWALYDTFLLPAIRRQKPVFWLFLMVFHIGLLLLLIGHIELMVDIEWLQIIPHEAFLGRVLFNLLTPMVDNDPGTVKNGAFNIGGLLEVETTSWRVWFFPRSRN